MTTKIPVELSSTPSIVDGGNATAITIDSSENCTFTGTTTTTGYVINNNTALFDDHSTLSAYSDTNGVYLNGKNAGWLSLSGDGTQRNNVRIYGQASSSGELIQFKTANSERMRINDSGTLQIGKTSSSATDAGHQFFQSGPYYLYSPATQAIRFYNTDIGSQAGHITINGSTISMADGTSDLSTKENINDWNENVLESFKNIKPVTFNYKNDKTKEVKKGYIAQNEVDKFPEAYAKNSEDNLHWFYPSEMTVYLMKAIQEQQEQIEALQSEINSLKGGE